MLLAFLLATGLIVFGYFILALCVAFFDMKIPGRLQFVGGAMMFFITCGATHAHEFLHALNGSDIGREDWASWHMLAIHVPQAISVYVAIWGLWNVQMWLRRTITENKFLRNELGMPPA